MATRSVALSVSSSPSSISAPAPAAAATNFWTQTNIIAVAAGGGGGLLLIIVVAVLLTRCKKKPPPSLATSAAGAGAGDGAAKEGGSGSGGDNGGVSFSQDNPLKRAASLSLTEGERGGSGAAAAAAATSAASSSAAAPPASSGGSGELPEGWFKRGPNADGDFWYDHPATAHTQWDPPDPSIEHTNARAVAAAQWKEGAGELPPEWDFGQTPVGEYYYIKPNQETTWADPRIEFEDYVREFEAAEKRGVHLRLYFRH